MLASVLLGLIAKAIVCTSFLASIWVVKKDKLVLKPGYHYG